MGAAGSSVPLASGQEGMALALLSLPALPHLLVALCKAPAQEGEWLLGERKGRLKFDAAWEAISAWAQR